MAAFILVLWWPCAVNRTLESNYSLISFSVATTSCTNWPKHVAISPPNRHESRTKICAHCVFNNYNRLDQGSVISIYRPRSVKITNSLIVFEFRSAWNFAKRYSAVDKFPLEGFQLTNCRINVSSEEKVNSSDECLTKVFQRPRVQHLLLRFVCLFFLSLSLSLMYDQPLPLLHLLKENDYEHCAQAGDGKSYNYALSVRADWLMAACRSTSGDMLHLLCPVF